MDRESALTFKIFGLLLLSNWTPKEDVKGHWLIFHSSIANRISILWGLLIVNRYQDHRQAKNWLKLAGMMMMTIPMLFLMMNRLLLSGRQGGKKKGWSNDATRCHHKKNMHTYITHNSLSQLLTLWSLTKEKSNQERVSCWWCQVMNIFAW